MVFYWSLSDRKSLQDPSQYSGRSQHFSSLDGLYSSSDFQFFQIHFQALEDRFKRANYNYITIILMFHNFLCSLVRSKYLSLLSLSLIFTLWSTVLQVLYFLLIITRSDLLAGIWLLLLLLLLLQTRSYLQPLCTNIECNLEDLPREMDDLE